ncbi:hypothetical protein EPI10_021675 [Gossypium australe]|uniref:Uncharacterized protein n=1 Tax=Gossypium australe TaxID=47621 RepID=A0A5B6WHD2_9ROSI|nr:hypothetical protein EPI10_021675 [Gossypium australe]
MGFHHLYQFDLALLSKQGWSESLIIGRWVLCQLLSLVGEFISGVLLEQQVEKRRQILGKLRGIWFCRNATVWKQKVLTADQLMHDVDEFLQGWLGD